MVYGQSKAAVEFCFSVGEILFITILNYEKQHFLTKSTDTTLMSVQYTKYEATETFSLA